MLSRDTSTSPSSPLASPLSSPLSRSRSETQRNRNLLKVSTNTRSPHLQPRDFKPSPLAQPASLTREWSSSTACGSLGPSSIAPSPNSRIRNIIHNREQMRLAPKLSGASFALVGAMFDLLSGGAPHPQSADELANLEDTISNHNNHLHRHQSNDRSDSLPVIDDEDDFDMIEHTANTDYVVPLSAFVTLVQAVASKLLTSPSTSVLNKMFLSQMLCEVYKLEHDLYFGDLVTMITTTSAVVVRVSQNGMATEGASAWSCDEILEAIVKDATPASAATTE
eukprot:c3704_g1_i1.p1 GENE.c3704_g1_i1~~c3704_g1_i1.p1  ORF type:complete len:280 (+),score=62.01 c3704_g1_i1:152-991(+)